MRLRTSGLAAAGFALVLTLWSRTPARADAPREGVVARVGSLTVSAGELERMIANIPPFQLRTLGMSPEEIRRNFLDRVVVREMLLAEGANADKLGERADVDDRVRSLLRSVLLGKLRADVAKNAPATDADVKEYFEKNVAKYNSPERVALWRILVATREEAQQVLDEANKDLKPARWNELARERSLDKATSMRGGALGFVAPNGVTAEPGVKVDPALLAAAAKVEDGKLVPEPVREGERWAVLWRRQTMKAVVRTIEQEAPSIRQTISHERAELKVKELLATLRKERVSGLNDEAVTQLEISQSGEIQTASRPGVLPAARRASAAPPGPAPGPGGLR